MTDTWQNEVGNIKVNDRGMRVAQRDGQEELLLEGQVNRVAIRMQLLGILRLTIISVGLDFMLACVGCLFDRALSCGLFRR